MALLLSTLSITHYLLLISGLFALIPVISLYKMYRKTRIVEYGVFSAVFLLSSLFTVTEVLAQVTNNLIFWILCFSFRNFTYFLFFTHAMRMIWSKPRNSVLYFGVIQYSIVQLLLFLWKPLNDGTVMGFVTSDGFVIYSTDNRTIGNLFQMYVAILFLYGYFSVNLVNPSKRLSDSLKIMKAVAIALLVSRIIRLVQNFGFPDNNFIEYAGAILFLSAFILVAYVIYYNPGSIMLSRAQVDGIIIISGYNGTPISTAKFEGANLQGAATLLSGIISAVQSVLGSIDNQIHIKEIDAGNRAILVHHERDFYFMIITNTVPTTLLRSSLQYFARIFFTFYPDEIKNFIKKGVVLTDIKKAMDQAFPFTKGLTLETW
ncbi:MAG: hypothetical protein INQ03_06055 [Candidatus Heimdallarchaeota archaeon]|nr:hypothetical protein [Candidatus Heimdallarchaeota archaeon]